MPQPFVILTWRSVWQTPLAARRTRISSSPRSSKAIGSTATLSPAAFSIAPRSLTTRGYAPVFIERSFGISSPPVARLVGRLSAPTLVRRRQRRSAEREKSIHAAALRIFRQKGYHAASMQNIADAVGLYKGSLYYYVSSKEELLVRRDRPQARGPRTPRDVHMGPSLVPAERAAHRDRDRRRLRRTRRPDAVPMTGAIRPALATD